MSKKGVWVKLCLAKVCWIRLAERIVQVCYHGDADESRYADWADPTLTPKSSEISGIVLQKSFIT